MNTPIRRGALGMALATAVALTGACMPDSRTAAAAEVGAPANELAPLATVDRAVTVALAIRAAPAASDSILSAQGLTRAGFDSLMYVIAADATMARAYTEAIR